jgi:hypothetical protein
MATEPSVEQQKQEEDTCTSPDPTCTSKESEAQAGQPKQEQEQEQQTEEGIRTIPIQMPGGAIQAQSQAQSQALQAASPHAAPPPQQQGPGMRNLVRFLKNPEGAIARNDSDYLRTLYSTDQADLVVKSPLNSGSYY